MTSEIRDLYGQLIDGMQGTRGQLRTGGDGRRRAAGQPADAKAAGAVFRHRHGRGRRHRGNQLRDSGIRRHRARDGGGLDRDQARPRHHRRHRARSGGADRDAAALPAQWRPRHHELRSRQRRRRGRRLRHQRQDLRPGEDHRQSGHHDEARRQAAHLDVAGARRQRRRRHRAARRRHQGPERADAGAALCARRQGGDADPGAPLDPHAGQGRKPDADLGHVLGSGAGHRRRVAVGRPVDRARCRDHPQGARPLSVRLLRTDHQPRDAAALRQRSRRRRASGDGHRRRPAHQGRHRPAAGAAGLERLVRPVVGGRRRCLARCLRDRLPDPRPRKGICGAGRAVPQRARPRPQLGGQCRRAGKGRRPRSGLRSLRAGQERHRADRRPALSRRHQAEQPRDADRQGAAGRGAGAGRRPRPRRTGLCGGGRQPGAEAGAGVRPRRLRLGAARCRGAGLAGQRRQCAAGDADAGGRSASRRRAG